ncbi:unnamed protein product [Diamesa hyperborea]
MEMWVEESKIKTEDYEMMLEAGWEHNLLVKTSDEQTIEVHKNILKIRCPKFMEVFDDQINLNSIEVNMDHNTLFEFFRYIYCGRVKKMDKYAEKLLDLFDTMELYEPSLDSEATMDDKINNIEESYEELLKQGLYSDLIIMTSDNQEIKAHKAVIASRCPSFAVVFESNMENDFTSLIKMLEFDRTTIFEFLRYVYCGKIENITKVAGCLVQIANKYNLTKLKEKCSDSLIQSLSTENVIEHLLIADSNNCNLLKAHCMDFIKKNYKAIKEDNGCWKHLDNHSNLMLEIVDMMATKVAEIYL